MTRAGVLLASILLTGVASVDLRGDRGIAPAAASADGSLSGATSGHSAMCDVRNVPSAAVSETRQ